MYLLKVKKKCLKIFFKAKQTDTNIFDCCINMSDFIFTKWSLADGNDGR